MSNSVLSISLSQKYSPGQLAQIATLDPLKVNASIATSIKRLLVEHLGRFDRDHPNKMGGTRTHFVGDMAKGVNETHDIHGATIQITHVGILQKIFGGDIVPRMKKLLTIPAIAEAYGKSQSEFPDLKFGYAYNPALGIQMMALIRAGRTFVKLSGRGANRKFRATGAIEDRKRLGSAVFWLVKKVHQQPTDGILPEKEEIEHEISETLTRLLKPMGMTL